MAALAGHCSALRQNFSAPRRCLVAALLELVVFEEVEMGSVGSAMLYWSGSVVCETRSWIAVGGRLFARRWTRISIRKDIGSADGAHFVCCDAMMTTSGIPTPSAAPTTSTPTMPTPT